MFYKVKCARVQSSVTSTTRATFRSWYARNRTAGRCKSDWTAGRELHPRRLQKANAAHDSHSISTFGQMSTLKYPFSTKPSVTVAEFLLWWQLLWKLDILRLSCDQRIAISTADPGWSVTRLKDQEFILYQSPVHHTPFHGPSKTNAVNNTQRSLFQYDSSVTLIILS